MVFKLFSLLLVLTSWDHPIPKSTLLHVKDRQSELDMFSIYLRKALDVPSVPKMNPKSLIYPLLLLLFSTQHLEIKKEVFF